MWMNYCISAGHPAVGGTIHPAARKRLFTAPSPSNRMLREITLS
jgi:hypothetical protein